ncbi:UDP-4-amino-4,6-dideoxy-N-acetyl-beta-L-altrosamine transaminase [Reinekea sp. G2M2-21]|uniref:UDP-4-amino-4, 6-dideoxy-N-acetyl-beta-L-altrosamine transaminase n=1 Tax=Reinekea sp. G2M2-21 TaxID=2788942 RepID=UPI0018A97928|nr:UDP-4-amino-4,6-dideoxy-N-acetyl-beta-L-altrosamine transaminase [Reinekea sp. G2M2-21]
MIPYGSQWLNDQDIDAVVEVLRSDFLTQGPQTPKFEQKLAAAVQCRAAVVTNSATSALHVACLALEVGPGDLVWTSPLTFVASANCALYCGASVDFVDIEPSTGNMSVDALQQKLALAKPQNRLPKVIIPVHFAGAPCDMREISQLARSYGISVIEDASHALGARYGETIVGDCSYSEITVFSFHPVKMITTGEGGCLCTNDQKLEQKARLLVSHGITKSADEFNKTEADPWWYEQHSLGFNYRMTDIQAALGISQLTKLADWVERRNQLITRYQRMTEKLPIEWLTVDEQRLCSYHLAVIKVSPDHRRPLFYWLRQHNIGCQVHYIPIYQQPYHAQSSQYWPRCEAFYRQIISLPLFPRMTNAEQDEVVKVLEEYF